MSEKTEGSITATMRRWKDERQRVTTGARSGHVIGYVAIEGDPIRSVAQIESVKRKVIWVPFFELRELGLRPRNKEAA